MKSLSKRRVLLIACVVLAAIAIFNLVAYATITVIGNSITLTPRAVPTLTLAVNATVPFIGDTVLMQATLSSAQSGVLVYFYSNSTQLGSATTNSNGIATYYLLITNTDVQIVQPKATLT